MSQFNTTPLSYTGDEFSTEEKAQFRVDWDLLSNGDTADFSSVKVAGTTVVDASRNFTGGSGSFSGNVAVENASPNFISRKTGATGHGNQWRTVISANSYLIQASDSGVGNETSLILEPNGRSQLNYNGSNRLETTSSGIDVTGTVTASGGYLPFTGVHIARSDKDLKIGELVQIKSKGWINEKQPDWVADYCNGSEQGVYGIVYDVFNEDILEEQDVEVEIPVMIKESYFETEIKLIDGEYQKVEIEKTREIQVYDEYPIKDSDETHKIPRTTTEIQKQDIKVGSRKVYHIAATGDGFCYTDSAVEYGDYLVPSKTKGLVSAYKGDGMPKNFVGIAGETKLEAGKISWTKE